MKPLQRRAAVSWAAVALLAALCGIVAVLQYRWIGEISEAERQRLQEQLRDRLDALRTRFDQEISNACAALQPDSREMAQAGAEQAYAARVARLPRNRRAMFRRIAIATPDGDTLNLALLDTAHGTFVPAAWPVEWNGMRERLFARMEGRPLPAASAASYALLEMPRFGPDRREQNWLIVELDTDSLRTVLLPDLLRRYLGQGGKSEYDAEVQVDTTPPTAIFESSLTGHALHDPDGSIQLLQGPSPEPGAAPLGVRVPLGRPPQHRLRGATPVAPRISPAGPGWTLLVRHKAGSLEALVEQTRLRNLALSAGLLLLIVATVTAMVRISRQAQQLAALQINFVAGVSHEFRTPLTVIRTAAYNLRGRLAARPEQVERYGNLIQHEAEKLQALVEQVLRFASVKAGVGVRRLEPVNVIELLEKSLESYEAAAGQSGTVFEKHLDAGLPPILADEVALQHALQNLVDNAVKYGAEGGNWVGISAMPVEDSSGTAVEIRVADRGPGIPPDEQRQIFDPFYRGRRAVTDQIHGTGLGLALAKNIVEAHGGSLAVDSEPGRGCEFIVRLPAQIDAEAATLRT